MPAQSGGGGSGIQTTAVGMWQMGLLSWVMTQPTTSLQIAEGCGSAQLLCRKDSTENFRKVAS